jgi:hypothetical protein
LNLSLSLFVCLFVCLYVVSFLFFFASVRADISYLFFNLPRLRA